VIDLFVLALTLATALEALRGIVWFGLACAALLPALATRRPGTARFDGRAAEVLTWAAVAATAGAIVWLAVRPSTSYAGRFPTAVSDIVRAGASSGRERVLASDTSADWLLWRVPSLRGRIGYDVRFELLTRRQVARLVAWSRLAPGWQAATAGYSLVVADPRHVAALVATGKWRRLTASQHVDVAVRLAVRDKGTAQAGRPDGVISRLSPDTERS
jgi:hypothetical protein